MVRNSANEMYRGRLVLLFFRFSSRCVRKGRQFTPFSTIDVPGGFQHQRPRSQRSRPDRRLVFMLREPRFFRDAMAASLQLPFTGGFVSHRNQQWDSLRSLEAISRHLIENSDVSARWFRFTGPNSTTHVSRESPQLLGRTPQRIRGAFGQHLQGHHVDRHAEIELRCSPRKFVELHVAPKPRLCRSRLYG
jgi:hypothetical protein